MRALLPTLAALLCLPATAQTVAGLSVGFIPYETSSGISSLDGWLDARAERPIGPPLVLGQPLRVGGRLAYVDGNGSGGLIPEATLSAHPLATGLLDPYAMAHAGYALGINGGGGATAGLELGVSVRVSGIGVSGFADLRRGGTVFGSTVSF